MKAFSRSMGFLFLLASIAHGATITGTVKDPGGAPMKGAFVRARSAGKSKITVSVLSDKQGRYKMENLSSGKYDIWVTAIGYNNDPPASINVPDGRLASRDFALQKGMVRWSDLNEYQGRQLLPEGKGKEMLFGQCYICHGFQTRMAATHRDEKGWVTAVNFMKVAMHPRLAATSDQDFAAAAAYLNNAFGVNATLAKSPAEMPGYKETVRQLGDDGMKIVYVDYDLPGPDRMPFSAAPDKDGKIWIPEFGTANKIARLDPGTGEVQEFTTPHHGTADIHSAYPGPDGVVWFAQQASNKLGKWDPKTGKITEYQDAYLPGKEGIEAGGSKHTTRVDRNGYVWSSGAPLTRFDPKAETFTRYAEVPNAYDVNPDKNGDIWFTNYGGSQIGKGDANTGKVKIWSLPDKGHARRIVVDSDGIAWAGDFTGGKIDRFDPKTETFKQYQLPGPSPTPYALALDRDGNVWYSSHDQDTMGRLNTKTGEITEYPIPYSENYMKELFLDAQGRMWFGTPPNNKVGYFTVTN